MTSIAAVILAGGRGERMGGANKALLELDGRRFIDLALAAVSDCGPILISTAADLPAVGDATQIRDLPTAYAGPLAGVAAAVAMLAAAPCDFLISMAVDTPCFPADFVSRAMAAIEGADCVMATFAGQDYPTNALWRLPAITTLPANVLDGTAPHSLKRLAEGLRCVRLDYAAWAAANPFANANTPEELAILRARFGGSNER